MTARGLLAGLSECYQGTICERKHTRKPRLFLELEDLPHSPLPGTPTLVTLDVPCEPLLRHSEQWEKPKTRAQTQGLQLLFYSRKVWTYPWSLNPFEPQLSGGKSFLPCLVQDLKSRNLPQINRVRPKDLYTTANLTVFVS